MLENFFAGLVLAPVVVFCSASQALAETSVKHFENWTFSCEEKACQIFVTLADNKTKIAKYSLSIVYDGGKNATSAILRMPLGVALAPGVRVFADGTNFYDWPYQVCEDAGCQAVAVLEDPAIAKFKTADALQVQFIAYGSKKQDSFKIPMAGFNAAYDMLVTEAKK